MYSTSDFRIGLKIELDNEPYIITYFQHVKPGKGGAFVRTKLKNIITKAVLERTFRSGEKVGKPDIEEKSMSYSYKEAPNYVFMDNETYEQVFIAEDDVGNAASFIKEDMEVSVLFFKGKPVEVVLPIFVELRVIESEPGVKGDTATGATKPAIMETGLTLNVPLFIQEGDILKIDTRTGEYMERVKK